MKYEARQHETFGPIPDNEWKECSEDAVRARLGSSTGKWTFQVAHDSMMRGDVVTYCGLIDFRMSEVEK
jgi:hypothetical protein